MRRIRDFAVLQILSMAEIQSSRSCIGRANCLPIRGDLHHRHERFWQVSFQQGTPTSQLVPLRALTCPRRRSIWFRRPAAR